MSCILESTLRVSRDFVPSDIKFVLSFLPGLKVFHLDSFKLSSSFQKQGKEIAALSRPDTNAALKNCLTFLCGGTVA